MTLIDNNGTVSLAELAALSDDPAVHQLGEDLEALSLRLGSDVRRHRDGSLQEQLATEWPDRYSELTDDEFKALLLCADLVVVAAELQAEDKARRDHPNASLDWVRQLLADSMPDKYRQITNHALARKLREGGVPVQTVRLHDGTTAKGIRRRDLDAAITARRL